MNMTYGASHLLIGGGDCQGEEQYKGGHYMKNKNIGGVLSTQPDQQKRPQCKNAQKCKKEIINKKNMKH